MSRIILTLASGGPGHYRSREWEVDLPWTGLDAENLYRVFQEGGVGPNNFIPCSNILLIDSPQPRALIQVRHIEMVELR